MGAVRERKIENYLRGQVTKKLKGIAYKWASPGNIGVPDRLVVLPGGVVDFIELKAPGKKPTTKQELQISRLRSRGANVWVIDSIEGVDEYIRLRGGDCID